MDRYLLHARFFRVRLTGGVITKIIILNICFRRITSLACECGYVKLLRVDVKTNKVIYNFSTRFSNYISRVYIYPQSELKMNFSFLDNQRFHKLKEVTKAGKVEDRTLNLVVVNTILPTIVFQ